MPETMAEPAEAAATMAWPAALSAAWRAGWQAAAAPVRVPLPAADGATAAEPVVARTDLPAFPTSSVDGWAVRGPGPWRETGQVLAGAQAPPLTADGECVEIATGAMVPAGATAIVRLEHGARDDDGRVTGSPRHKREWRDPGEEAAAGEELAPAGTPVTPGLIGLAASCGYDDLAVRPRSRAAVAVFGDELLTSGPPGAGRVRDALGPQLPAWLRRLGADVVTLDTGHAAGHSAGDSADAGDGAGDGAGDRARHEGAPVADTLGDHVAAVRAAAAAGVDVLCTTGGTMHGPVDHLHPALARLGAEYIVDTVAVRPGFPMLLARLPRPDGGTLLLAGLPGNPQSAVIGVVTLVAPVLAGRAGRSAPAPDRLPRVRLGTAVSGRRGDTHLALVRRDPADGAAYPVPHAGSAMLRGLSAALGFAVLDPDTDAAAGDEVPLAPLPLFPEEHR